MFKRVLSIVLIAGLALGFNITSVLADSRDEEISTLKTQVQELLKRIEKLETDQEKTKEEISKKVESKVDLANTLSKLKIKGRWAAGFYDSGDAGSFDSGSFEAPEGKIQFAFAPDDINNIIMRLSVNNAAFNNLDYFYIDTDLKKLLKLGFPLSSRLGRMKVDFGEETFSNNPVESVLPSNSAGNVSGSDEGLMLSGKIGKAKPLGYSVSVTNGTTGTGSDTSTAKAFAGKLYYNIIDPLYMSASYYNSGQMKAASSEMGIGGLVAIPTGSARWTREMWELDLRYDFQKGKTINPPAYSDSKAIVRLSYGGFSDDSSQGTINKRTGSFGFAEGTYNLTKKFYIASRASFVDLDGRNTLALNGITANLYRRYSLGLGYRLSGNTILKLGYDWNRESGPSVDDRDNNLLAAIVASQF